MPADTNELRSLAAGDRYYWSTYYSGCENDYYGKTDYYVYSSASCDSKEKSCYDSSEYGYAYSAYDYGTSGSSDLDSNLGNTIKLLAAAVLVSYC